jgi:pterin-4a-carbinolamine dehydratase
MKEQQIAPATNDTTKHPISKGCIPNEGINKEMTEEMSLIRDGKTFCYGVSFMIDRQIKADPNLHHPQIRYMYTANLTYLLLQFFIHVL